MKKLIFRSVVRLFGCSIARCSAVLLLILSNTPTFSQSEILKYAHQVVDTLASPSMHGRGYVNKGDSIAAEYIKNEFTKDKLKPFGVNYFQRLFFSVNTFPTEIELTIDHNKLIPGKDFIIKSNSPSASVLAQKDFRAMDISKIKIYKETDISSEKKYKRISKKNFYGTAIIFNGCNVKDKRKFQNSISYITNKQAGGSYFLFTNEKLTWEISQNQNNVPLVECTCKDSAHIGDFKTIAFHIRAELILKHESQNIIGYIPGSQYPDSFIVFSAHYDHLGQMGKDVYFPGANDNASGCAMLLNLAKYYSQHPPKYSIAFMAFGGEEVGLLGSKYYVEHPLFPLKQIKFLVNMDIMGTGDEGIKVVNATEHKKEFDELVKINTEKNLLPSVQPRGKAANSDHYFFEEAGVKTFFIYTLGGIKAYHDIYDRPETLPLTKFEEAYKLLIDFSDYLQK